MYLRSVTLPGQQYISDYLEHYSVNDYPHFVFLEKDLTRIEFGRITIFYGNNGSGKSTLLNLIGEKLGCERKQKIFIDVKHFIRCTDKEQINIPYKPFDDFLSNIDYSLFPSENEIESLPNIRKVITSDDIFSEINFRINKNNLIIKQTSDKRNKYKELNSGYHKYTNMADYDELVKARRSTMHEFTKSIEDTKTKINSNGETAIGKFYNTFEENGLYLLDEPENCLSPIFQIELIKLIEDYARFFNCQFIIATHSPLILSLPGAKIYDLDAKPVDVKKWYELPNVKVYFEFFIKNKDKF